MDVLNLKLNKENLINYIREEFNCSVEYIELTEEIMDHLEENNCSLTSISIEPVKCYYPAWLDTILDMLNNSRCDIDIEYLILKTDVFEENVEEKIIVAICENNDYSIDIDETEVYISKYSNLGEDFGFYVDRENLLENIIEYCDDFDAEEHAEPFIEIRGQSGVPNSIQDLLDDAHEIAASLEDLANDLRKLQKEV